MPAGANQPVLRVAHVVLQLDRGGMEKLLVEFAQHANRQQFDLRFVSLSGRGALAAEIEACGWPVTALEEPPGLRPGMIERLRRLFRKWEIDIVHTHNTKPLLYAGPAARLAGVPVVVHTAHGQRYGSSRPHTWMFVLACRTANRVVCVSHDSARLRLREGVPSAKTCTIWNGINVSRFSCRGPNPDGPAVLVARLVPEKSVETLLRAAALALRAEPSFRLEIVGDGPRFAALNQLARDLGISRQVSFLGEVAEVGDLLGRARMFVLPSLTEGISLSLLEAMAQGLPVVATAVGGTPEVVVDGQSGLLVPPVDPAALAAAMLRIWSDPELSRRMGAAARQRVEQDFNVAITTANYESLYQELSRARRAGAWRRRVAEPAV
jgi:glycosyltransferase involved in cell wall biosynthesis